MNCDNQRSFYLTIFSSRFRKRKKKLKKKAKKAAAKKKKKGGAEEKPKDFEQEVQEAMAKQIVSERDMAGSDDRKRGYNSIYENKAPTEAEMEAYYRKRQRDEDPMKNF